MSIKMIDNYDSIPHSIADSFLKANPFYLGSVFDYYESIGKKTYYFYDDERIIPIVVSKKYIFKYGQFLSEPWIYIDKRPEKGEKEFLDEIIKECRYGPLHLDWIGQTPPSALFSEAPDDSIFIPFGSHVVDLTRTEEELWENVHSKHRNVIRKSEKCGVSVEFGGEELLSDYLIAEKDTMDRSNLPEGQIATYDYLFNEYKDHVVIVLARLGEQIQGGAIIIYSSAMGYYMHGASINNPITGAMNHLQWEIIKWLKSRGVKKYSFVGCRINEDEGSKYQGIQNFKKRFGGILCEGRMFKMIYNPAKYRLYKMLINIKSRGLGEDIIDQEIHKWI